MPTYLFCPTLSVSRCAKYLVPNPFFLTPISMSLSLFFAVICNRIILEALPPFKTHYHWRNSFEVQTGCHFYAQNISVNICVVIKMKCSLFYMACIQKPYSDSWLHFQIFYYFLPQSFYHTYYLFIFTWHSGSILCCFILFSLTHTAFSGILFFALTYLSYPFLS